MGIVAKGAHGQLAHVQLAQRDGASAREPRHRSAVLGGKEVVRGFRAAGGGKALHRAKILVGEGDAVEGAARLLLLQCARPPERPFRVHGDEGAQLRIEPLDALEISAHRLDR